MAGTAVAALAAALAGAVATYLVPARLNARRAIESRDAEHHLGATRRAVARLWRGVATAQRACAVRASRFAASTRSRRHLLILATYLGLGVALAGTRVLSASIRGRAQPLDQPVDYLLVVPLVLTFFLVLGVRAAFAVPTDVPANWMFRVVGPSHAAREPGRRAPRVPCAGRAAGEPPDPGDGRLAVGRGDRHGDCGDACGLGSAAVRGGASWP